MFAKFFVLLALLALSNALNCGSIADKVIAFAQSKDVNTKISSILSAVCAETIKKTGNCPDKIQNLAAILKGLAEVASKCESGASNAVNPLKNEVGAKSLRAVDAQSDDDYSCGSQCTWSAIESCTVSCGEAITICDADMFSSECINAAYECFDASPVCCTCGAYYEYYTCSVCGY